MGIESGLFFFNRPEWEIKQTLPKLQKSCNFTICKVAEFDLENSRKISPFNIPEGEKCKKCRAAVSGK